MTKYLQMNGISDYLKTPTMTFDRMEIQVRIPTDAFILGQAPSAFIFDNRGGGGDNRGAIYTGTFNNGLLTGENTFTQNGITITSNTEITKAQIITLAIKTLSAVQSTVSVISASQTFANFLKQDVFYVKYWNGANLVAFYDMRTGTVQDQSGNGNHATLTGGTWADDGLIISDSFNRADSTNIPGSTDTGQAWTSLAGNVGINAGRAYSPDTTTAMQVIETRLSDNFEASVDITWGYYAALAFRVADVNNFYLLRIFSGAGLQLYRNIAGTNTNPASYAFTPVAGQTYNVKVKVQGQNIIGYLDGVERINYTETDPTLVNNTKMGLRHFNSTTPGAQPSYFDNMSVKSLVLASDSFNRANAISLGAADTGQAWQISGSGAYGINSNQVALVTPASSGHNAAYIDVGVSDFDVSITLAILGASEYPKLVIRMQDSENMLMVEAGNGYYSLCKYSSGASTQFQQVIMTPKSGDIIRATASGSNITVYINGTQIINYTVTDFQTSTKTGFMAYKYSNSRLDDFVVRSLTSAKVIKDLAGTSSTTTTTGNATLRRTRKLAPAASTTTTTVSSAVIRLLRKESTNVSSTTTTAANAGLRRARKLTAGASATTVTASADVTVTPHGTIIEQMAGTSNTNTTTGNAALRRARKLAPAGSNTTTTTGNAVIRRARKLAPAGSTTTTSTGSAVIRRARKLAPATSATTTTVSSVLLLRLRKESGGISATTTTTSTAALKNRRKLAGTSATNISASADLTITAHGVIIEALAGASTTTTTTGSAPLRRARKMTGSVAETTTASNAVLRRASRLAGSSATVSALSPAILRRLRKVAGSSSTTTSTSGNSRRKRGLGGTSTTFVTMTAGSGKSVSLFGSASISASASSAPVRRARRVTGTAAIMSTVSTPMLKRAQRMQGASTASLQISTLTLYRIARIRGLSMTMTTTIGGIQYKTSNLSATVVIRGTYSPETVLRGTRKADTLLKGVL